MKLWQWLLVASMLSYPMTGFAQIPGVGCADGTREGFVDGVKYPSVAACEGAWNLPGIHQTAPACGREAGNNGANFNGVGCNVEDLCAPGWRVCLGRDDLANRLGCGTNSVPLSCDGAVEHQSAAGTPGSGYEVRPLFFLTRTSSTGAFNCAPDTIGSPASLDDIFGCGNLGCGVSPSLYPSCPPLNRGSHNIGSGLNTCGGSWCWDLTHWGWGAGVASPWVLTTTDPAYSDAGCIYNSLNRCQISGCEHEASLVTKTSSNTLGGVMCCKYECAVDADCAAVTGCMQGGINVCACDQNICLPDRDDDSAVDSCDNCPVNPNDTALGTCYNATLKQIGGTCTLDAQCELGFLCEMAQSDADADGLGDVCDGIVTECDDENPCTQEAFDPDTGCNVYAYSGSGSDCGLCAACDGDGNCDLTPTDDADCGEIDCDLLDVTCRNYMDLTSARCEAFGDCKDANTPSDCTVYRNSGTGADCGLCATCDGTGDCDRVPADDVDCPAVDCDAFDTTCRNYAYMSSGRCEGLGDCKEAPEDCAVYVNSGGDTPCGLCQACDGTGFCTATPPDDPDCGVIECDGMDTVCRDYHYLTSGRCEAFGDCKDPNTTDCDQYMNLKPGIRCDLCAVCNGRGSCTAMPIDDPACGEIDCSGLDGACVDYSNLTFARCEGLRDCKDPNSEDCTLYAYSGSGTACELCTECDGAGGCNVATADDPDCGEIDCNGLDTNCRDYAVLTTNRCATAGMCKLPNDAATCTAYLNSGAGTLCDLCAACDGTGLCSQVAIDDPVCGEIDCDELDATCRNYLDLLAGRCKAIGECKTPNSADCTAWVNASGTTSCGVCKTCDGIGACLGTPADDVSCGVIDCDGLDGLCRDYLDLAAGRCEGFGDCKDANSADCQQYVNSGSGTWCGLCSGCNGLGACSTALADDALCGVVDCDGRDTTCRNFADLTANRCEGMGDCKDANSADCTSFADANVGTVCGVCMTCNGGGSCSSTPLDDTGCGVIDCDGLDRACRDYQDIMMARCKGFGLCLVSNTEPDCGTYVNSGSGTPCEDDTVCNGVEACDGLGTCASGTALECGDEFECTADGCDPKEGCYNELEARYCIIDESCVVGGTLRPGNVCQRCWPGDSTSAWSDVFNGMPCDDGERCTVGDACVDGACISRPVICPETDACHTPGVCNALTGRCETRFKDDEVLMTVRVFDVGTLGGASSAIWDVTAGGIAVGEAETATGLVRAVTWTRSAGMTEIPVAVGAQTRALGINEAGQVAGTIQMGEEATEAFVYDAAGEFEVLGPVDEDSDRWVVGPSEDGWVAWSGHAFKRDRGVVAIPVLSGGHYVRPMAVSENGFVAGEADNAAGKARAFVWERDEGMHDLGTLGGETSRAFAVNAEGAVVGSADNAAGKPRAFLWTAAGGMQDLGVLCAGAAESTCGDSSEAVAINAVGQVAGWSTVGDGTVRGFVWAEGLGMRDIGALSEGGETRVRGMNDLGQVTGVSKDATGTLATFVWLPENGMTQVDAASGGDVAGIGPRGHLYGTMTTEGEAVHGFVTVVPRTTCQLCLMDDEAPELICPEATSLVSGAETCGVSGALVSLVAKDTCTAADRLVIVGGPGEWLGLGVTEVTWVVTDDDGNQATCTSTVQVRDETPPVIACDPVIRENVLPDRCGWVGALSADVTDQCDGVSKLGMTSRDYPVGRTEVVFGTADAAGNEAQCVTNVIVTDEVAPVVRCNAPAVLTGDDLPAVIVVTATDVCQADLQITGLECLSVRADGSSRQVLPCDLVIENGEIIVKNIGPDANRLSWTATGTDPSGNTTTVDCAVPLRDLPDLVVPVPDAPTPEPEGNVVCVGDECAAGGEVSLHGFGCAAGTGTPRGMLPGLLLLAIGWMAFRVRRQGE